MDVKDEQEDKVLSGSTGAILQGSASGGEKGWAGMLEQLLVIDFGR